MDHDSAELHTPPLNKIGLPDGLTEYSIRSAIRDLSKLYGSQQARVIVDEILDDETECRR